MCVVRMLTCRPFISKMHTLSIVTVPVHSQFDDRHLRKPVLIMRNMN